MQELAKGWWRQVPPWVRLSAITVVGVLILVIAFAVVGNRQVASENPQLPQSTAAEAPVQSQGEEVNDSPSKETSSTVTTDQTSAPECEIYGPIQGVPDPGYCESTAEMKAAYADCLVGADTIARTPFALGSEDYWRAAKEAWNLSAPIDYEKNGDTLWACLLAYQVVVEEFPGPYF
jgi:cytoskeletal protein RodZ